MLTAYSDMSLCKTGAAGAAILMDGDTMVDYTLQRLTEVDTSYQGELLALTFAMQLVSENYDTPQRVTIYSDCKAVVKKAVECLNRSKILPSWACSEDWQRFLDYKGDHMVKVKHIPSHQEKRSFNVICDYAARIIAKLDEGD